MNQLQHTLFSDFLSKGFAVINIPQILDLISIDEFEIVNVEQIEGVDDIPPVARPRYQEQQMLKVVDYLKCNFLNCVFKEYNILSCSLWDGVDSGSLDFHNDSKEGQSFCFLIYFDDQKQETGGSISFKWPGGQETIIPKAGTVCWVNQQTKFQHRAERSKITRRVMCVEVEVAGWI